MLKITLRFLKGRARESNANCDHTNKNIKPNNAFVILLLETSFFHQNNAKLFTECLIYRVASTKKMIAFKRFGRQKKCPRKFIDNKKSSIIKILGVNTPFLQQFKTNLLFHVRIRLPQICRDTILDGAVEYITYDLFLLACISYPREIRYDSVENLNSMATVILNNVARFSCLIYCGQYIGL